MTLAGEKACHPIRSWQVHPGKLYLADRLIGGIDCRINAPTPMLAASMFLHSPGPVYRCKDFHAINFHRPMDIYCMKMDTLTASV